MNLAAGVKSDVLRDQLEVEFLENPIFVGVHFKTGHGRLDGSQEIQVEHRAVGELITFCLGRDGLGSVTDLLAAVKYAPPFFDVFRDLFRTV